MKPNLPEDVLRKVKYFPIQDHWRRLRPIFHSPEATRIWSSCFEEYDMQKREELANHFKQPISYKPHRFPHTLPSHWDSCDWRCERSGRSPKFWDFVCHAACHWVVDLCLYSAMEFVPELPWRVVTSQKHSTVWNGDLSRPVLFDINFLALDVEPSEALKLAWMGRQLKPAKYLKEYLHGGGLTP